MCRYVVHRWMQEPPAHAGILQRVAKVVFITLCRASLVNIDPLCLSAGFVCELCTNTHFAVDSDHFTLSEGA